VLLGGGLLAKGFGHLSLEQQYGTTYAGHVDVDGYKGFLDLWGTPDRSELNPIHRTDRISTHSICFQVLLMD